MSRVAKAPIALPKGVELKVESDRVSVKGAKQTLTLDLPSAIRLEVKDQQAAIAAESARAHPMLAGTIRARLNGMVVGVSKGYSRKLTLVGVGYRAQVQGKKLNLTVGFSHPVEYAVPEGIAIETPSQTEIVVKGADKQLVGQVAAEIRAFRPPEAYKGKGVRYSDERVVLKEAKKK